MTKSSRTVLSSLSLLVGFAVLASGCATDSTVSDAELEDTDALLGLNLDLKALKAEKERKRADLLAKQAEEAANPNRRVLIKDLWRAEGPKPDDVVQNMSDCYFAAAAAAFAHARPDFLQFGIQPRFEIVDNKKTSNQLGYSVNTFEMADDGTYNTQVANTVEIENSLPLAANGKLLFGYGGNNTFWFPVIERAFAKDQGGYDKIGAYGMAGAALFRITGVHVDVGLIANWRTEANWRRIKAAEDNKQPLVTCNVIKTPLLPGMTSHHCNALVGYEEKDGERWVRMYNSRQKLYMPNANLRVKENTSNGYFWLSLKEWISAYDYMVYTTQM